jgi:internalin A
MVWQGKVPLIELNLAVQDGSAERRGRSLLPAPALLPLPPELAKPNRIFMPRTPNLGQVMRKIVMKKSVLQSVAVIGVMVSCCLAEHAAAEGIFPDKNLEKVVRKYVFEKRDNDKPIVEEDVVNISTIKGKGQGIKDLTGLEKCRSLALLDLEDNEIEKIDAIKELKNIQSLNLAQNKIQDIKPIEGLTKLQYVHLAGNEISDLTPLSKLENLRSLYLSKNKIKDLKPLSELKKIWSLYIDENQIEDLKPLTGLKWLDSLNLQGNHVSDLSPLKDLTEWKFLFLANNKVTDLGVLIEMGKKDREGSQRFSFFWQIYLNGNPLSDEAKKTQLPELKKLAKIVEVEKAE